MLWKIRLAVRDQYIKLGDQMKADGHCLMGVALLNEKEEMIGSVMILDYPTKKELDAWLQVEPYVVHKVWEKVEVIPCLVGPSFAR